MNKICIEGLFIYISERRLFSINHSNDIASTNKVVKSINGCLEVKCANISTIINDLTSNVAFAIIRASSGS